MRGRRLAVGRVDSVGCARVCAHAARDAVREARAHRRHGPRGHVDVGRRVARRPHPRRRSCRAASGRCRRPAATATRITDRLQRRAPADLVARRQVDHVLRVPRRRLRHLGGRARRIESAQADLGRRSTIASRSGRMTARASRSRRTAAIRSAATTTSGRSTIASGELRQLTKHRRRRLHAVVVAGRQGDRVRVDARGRPVGVGGQRRDRRRAEARERRAAASTRRRGARRATSCIT